MYRVAVLIFELVFRKFIFFYNSCFWQVLFSAVSFFVSSFFKAFVGCFTKAFFLFFIFAARRLL